MTDTLQGLNTHTQLMIETKINYKESTYNIHADKTEDPLGLILRGLVISKWLAKKKEKGLASNHRQSYLCGIDSTSANDQHMS